MYRFVTLRGAHDNSNFTVHIPGRPRSLMDNCKDLDVFFTHGFNVSEADAHAWGSEVFKRLWQSGSNARFWMFTWSGDYNWLGAFFNGLHYQQDVYQALKTGAALKAFVEDAQLDFSKRILMSQSLGNMVACEALRQGLHVNKYFMFNAAIASEAVDGTLQNLNGTIRSKYAPTDWQDYNAMSWAANWFRWFQNDTTDSRGKIGWPGYFSTAIGKAQSIYNYYSTGDEVFAETSGMPWALEGMSVSFANYAWQKQEVLKGSGWPGGTAYGGWCFHNWTVQELEIGIGGISQYVDRTYKYSVSEANAMVSDGSVTNNPVFNRDADEMFDRNAPVNDQQLCLAKYVPAVSSAIDKTAPCGDVIDSIDLNGSSFRNGWGRSHPNFGDAWFHSDMKDMAYFYVYKLYDNIVKTRGGLQ